MKYTKYILSIVIPFGLFYLVGCLAVGSFSLLDWSYEVRVIISTISLVSCLFLIIHNIALDMAKIDVNDIWVYEHEIVEK